MREIVFFLEIGKKKYIIEQVGQLTACQPIHKKVVLYEFISCR